MAFFQLKRALVAQPRAHCRLKRSEDWLRVSFCKALNHDRTWKEGDEVPPLCQSLKGAISPNLIRKEESSSKASNGCQPTASIEASSCQEGVK
jgi:hypothetical protein